MRKYLSMLVMLLCLAMSAVAQNDYYVSTSGSDSNSGTKASPWLTIDHAIANFSLSSNGAIIHVAGGAYHYTGNKSCVQGEGPSLCISRGGSSPSVPLILQCDDHWTVPSSSAGCHLTSTSGTIISLGAANFVTIRGGWDFTGAGSNVAIIAGCDGHNPTTVSGFCPNGNGLIIDGIYAHDMGQTDGCASTGVISAGPSHGSHAQYQYPPILRNGRIQHIGNLALARRNGGTCNQYHASYLSVPGAQIYNMEFLDVVSYSVHAYSYPCAGFISHNTIVRDGASGFTFSGGDCPNTGQNAGKESIVNNIIIDSGQFAGTFNSDGSCTGSSLVLLAGNVSNTDFNNTTSCDQKSGNILGASGASLFVNYLGSSSTSNGNDDLHLKAGSPAIGKGVSQCVSGGLSNCIPPTDFDGNTRPTSGPQDAGAHKSGASTPPLNLGLDDLPDSGGPDCVIPTGCWQWKHDDGTTGTSTGSSALVTSPTVDGQARRFIANWTNFGGERFVARLGSSNLDSKSTHFTYHVRFYITSLAGIGNLEFDTNQDTDDGNTVIFGMQCKLPDGIWEYTSNDTSLLSQWNMTAATCPASQWTLNTWHTLDFNYHRSSLGVVTYESVAFDGVVKTLGVTASSTFTLTFPIGQVFLNFQIGGNGTNGQTTAYFDDFILTGGTSTSVPPAPTGLHLTIMP